MSKRCGNYWTCKIGPAVGRVPAGGDSPLRKAVEEAFYRMFGEDAEVTFSGWGGKLDQIEQEIKDEELQYDPFPDQRG